MTDGEIDPTASAALVRELSRVQQLHADRVGNPILTGSLERVAHWQAQRLAMTYADLSAHPRYAAAIAFFQNDLYGPGDFSRRDADLARVVPLMVKVLPERVIATVALAMELSALSQEFDRVLLTRLPRADGHFNVLEYCKAFRRAGNFPMRRRQIKLIVDVGTALDVHVGRPLTRTALTMMRRPARLAGLSGLQDFLERGFAAFRAMRGAKEFLDTIEARETQILDAIIDGATDPFPNPLLFRPSAGSPVPAKE
jgi:hypothetical protein